MPMKCIIFSEPYCNTKKYRKRDRKTFCGEEEGCDCGSWRSETGRTTMRSENESVNERRIENES